MMIVVSLALLIVALGAPAPDPVLTVFQHYCAANNQMGPYCQDLPPANIQWLVLRSVCAAGLSPYSTPCAEFTAMSEDDNKWPRRFLTYTPRTDQWKGVRYKRRPEMLLRRYALPAPWRTT